MDEVSKCHASSAAIRFGSCVKAVAQVVISCELVDTGGVDDESCRFVDEIATGEMVAM
jgi:hypothetical protein